MIGVFAGCGGDEGPSSADAASAIVQSISDVGVTVADTEQACLREKVAPRLQGADLKATAINQLSQPVRVQVAGDVESCLSNGAMARLVPRAIAKEAGLSVPAAACVEQGFDGEPSYQALVRQERKAVDAIAKLVRKCASAR